MWAGKGQPHALHWNCAASSLQSREPAAVPLPVESHSQKRLRTVQWRGEAHNCTSFDCTSPVIDNSRKLKSHEHFQTEATIFLTPYGAFLTCRLAGRSCSSRMLPPIRNRPWQMQNILGMSEPDLHSPPKALYSTGVIKQESILSVNACVNSLARQEIRRKRLSGQCASP